VPPDPSLEPEKTASILPKDFVRIEPRFESAGIEDTQPIHGLVADVASLSKRLDYVEHPDLTNDGQHVLENQAVVQEKSNVRPETDAQLEPAVDAEPNLKPELSSEVSWVSSALPILHTTINSQVPPSNVKPSRVKPSSPKPSKPAKTWWQRIVQELLLETLLPAWLIVTFLLIPVGVRGESMYPTLSSGDFLLVAKLERWLAAWGLKPNYLHRGDVIVLKPPIENAYSFEPVSRLFESLPLLDNFSNRLPEDWKFRPYFVKRIIGMAGDTVEVKNGVVYINSQKSREFYINTPAAIEDSGPTYVKTGTVFVMGDNRLRGSSLDSRVFGLVHLQDIAGRAVLRLGHSAKACKGVLDCVFMWLNGWHLGAP
jgi:signal peptidase I